MKILILAISLTTACASIESPPITVQHADEVIKERVSADLIERSHAGTDMIELDKSIFWKTASTIGYFFAVHSASGECKLAFAVTPDSGNYSKNSYSYPDCYFIRTEIIDIDNDDIPDFRVWVKLSHQMGSPVIVEHSFDFIYDKSLNMFCRDDTRYPC